MNKSPPTHTSAAASKWTIKRLVIANSRQSSNRLTAAINNKPMVKRMMAREQPLFKMKNNNTRTMAIPPPVGVGCL